MTAGLVLLLGAGSALPARAAERELRLRGWAEIRGSVPLRLHRRPAAWLLVLPGPLGLAGYELARRARRGRRRTPGGRLPLLAVGLLLALPGGGEAGPSPAGPLRQAAGWVEEAERAARRGEPAAALRLYERVEEVLPDSAALQWNLAGLQRRAGRTAEAVHHLRRALRLDPLDRAARRELQELERAAGLTAQVAPEVPLPPDAPFTAFLVLGNLAAAAAVLFRRRNSHGAPAAGALALAVLLALLSLVALGGLIGLRLGEGRLAGVAAAGGSLSRIPEPGALESTPLPAGTTLRLRGGVSGYWLAETGLGLRGWIPRGRVLVDDPGGL